MDLNKWWIRVAPRGGHRYATGMNPATHWDAIYSAKAATGVSWYRPHLDTSLALIGALGLARDARIVDVGGGASTLVDDLVAAGWSRVHVLDIAAAPIDVARQRLGARADAATWQVADITTAELPAGGFDLWHDRAVFHFLRGDADRRRYVDQVRRAVAPGGHVLVATFAADGPTRCSGLDIVRYDADSLHAEFGDAFERTRVVHETHHTPWGSDQAFVYCLCRVRA